MLTFLLLATHPAIAGAKAPAGPACLAAAQTALAEAGPAATGKAWVDLATCDEASGKATAHDAITKMIAGSGADAAAVKAIQLGLGAELRGWTPSLQPDERSAFFNTLGEQCAVAEVPTFFAETAKELGDKFWTDRWYAGLDVCRTPAAVEVLKAGLVSQAGEASRFNGILQTLARNLGNDALPLLDEKLAGEKSSEIASFLIGAYADAAGVGSTGGVNRAAAEAAIASIVKAAPSLPETSLETARTTLLALGSELQSDSMAAQRYRSLAQADGSLQYGLYVAKVATCKKDTRVEIHTALAVNAARTWPDQLVARVKPTVDMWQWHFPKDCTGEVVVTGSSTPLRDKAAFDAFIKALDAEMQKKNPELKAKVFPEDDISL